ncbi:hypothetical protein ACFQ60_16470 [Streptomyces zhihengii]
MGSFQISQMCTPRCAYRAAAAPAKAAKAAGSAGAHLSLAQPSGLAHGGV